MEAAMAGALLSSQLPADVGEAIRTVKGQLRSQIGAVAAVFAEVEQAMRAEAAAVATDRAAGLASGPHAALHRAACDIGDEVHDSHRRSPFWIKVRVVDA